MQPEVMIRPETEPEAAHLRAVIRRIEILLGEMLCDPGVPPATTELIVQARKVVRDALRREHTNGFVIDALTRENGDLQSTIIDLQMEIRRMHEKGMCRAHATDKRTFAESGGGPASASTPHR